MIWKSSFSRDDLNGIGEMKLIVGICWKKSKFYSKENHLVVAESRFTMLSGRNTYKLSSIRLFENINCDHIVFREHRPPISLMPAVDWKFGNRQQLVTFGTHPANKSTMWLLHKTKYFFIILHFCILSSAKKCATKYTYESLNGYRCITENESYRNITGVQSYICTHLCMTSDDCSVTNYNTVGRFCLFSNDKCITLRKHADYQVNYISMWKRDHCIKWVSNLEFSRATLIGTSNCDSGGAARPCYVGRRKSATNILPGKYQSCINGPEGVWTILNGRMYTSGAMEILEVQPKCHVTWMPFSAGDPVPFVAVIGGYMVSSDSHLYVMRGQVHNNGNVYTVFGYYAPAAGKGYVEFLGIHILTTMDILILIWNRRTTF